MSIFAVLLANLTMS